MTTETIRTASVASPGTSPGLLRRIAGTPSGVFGLVVVVLVLQRSHWRPIDVWLGPVQDPFETVSFCPTTAEPVIDPADVTLTYAACAGGAHRSK